MNRSMTVKQLSAAYTVTPKTFRSWIMKNNDLFNELLRCGWQNGARVYTPKQVGLIVEFLGEFEVNDKNNDSK